MFGFYVIDLTVLNKRPKKRRLILRLRSSRYRQTPNNPKRIKAHLFSVSILAFTHGYSYFGGNLEEQDSSGRFNSYLSFIVLSMS